MADVFLSYARDDRERARRLAEALEAQRFTVFWNPVMPDGKSWTSVIGGEIHKARCVVVIWSRHGIESDWLHEVAKQAMGQGKLVPVLYDGVKAPTGFRDIQGADLDNWDGDTNNEQFSTLATAIFLRIGASAPLEDVDARPTGLPLPKSAPPAGMELPQSAPPTGMKRSLTKAVMSRVLDAFSAMTGSGPPKKPPGGGSPRPAPSPIPAPPPAKAAVEFTVYHPRRVSPDSWSTLLAYVHVPDAGAAIAADSMGRLEKEGAHEHESASAVTEIARGAEIRIVPELPGCQFNPPYAPVLWLEDWHRAEFKARASAQVPGFALGKAVNGRVAFYVESVLVGEVPIWTLLRDTAESPGDDDDGEDTASAPAYRAIFASYSHRDTDVVEGLEKAYKALGMTFLRDVESLRSGEEWNAALLGMIDKADIFQLYWSETARDSRYVEQEWRHALAQRKERFIRPVYWQKPMPDPPDDLAHLHFAFLPRE